MLKRKFFLELTLLFSSVTLHCPVFLWGILYCVHFGLPEEGWDLGTWSYSYCPVFPARMSGVPTACMVPWTRAPLCSLGVLFSLPDISFWRSLEGGWQVPLHHMTQRAAAPQRCLQARDN